MLRTTAIPMAVFSVVALLLQSGFIGAAEPKFTSHPPLRPLPTASNRPPAQGPAYYVDPGEKGNDTNDGSEARPWKSISVATKKLKPGDTLYLRGGIYYQPVALNLQGTAEQPITIRSYPGESAVIDGGYREFFDSPATSWEPVADGAPGEFRSVKTYPGLHASEKNHSSVFGNFADSMVPLHGYRLLGDLRSDNPYWTVTSKVDAETFISCGPGLFYDATTERIHIRLVHQNAWTFLEPERRYRGETDPRKLPLIVGGGLDGHRLQLTGCRHVRLQDFVLRGCSPATMELSDCRDVRLEGLTLFSCSSKPFTVTRTHGLTIQDCAFRGVAAPWTSRGHMKYRGVEAKVFTTYITEGNRDFEISNCEFTDACDGLFIGQVRNVDFHHNLVDNFSDDGFNLSAIFDRDVVGDFGDIRIHENRISRCLGMFVFGGRGQGNKEQAGAGISIYRNVLDLRPPVFYQLPKDDAEAAQVMAVRGTLMGDHGRGLWEPMHFYHNTVLLQGNGRADEYASGVTRGASRTPEWRVHNNIFVQVEKPLGCYIFSKGDGSHLQTDGNLHWSLQDRSLDQATFIGKVQTDSARIAQANGKKPSLESLDWAVHDLVADPQFESFSGDWRRPVDLRLRSGSPAVNAGVAIPSDWPDPLREPNVNKPDLGALPLGKETWGVGIGGRIPLFGEALSSGQ